MKSYPKVEYDHNLDQAIITMEQTAGCKYLGEDHVLQRPGRTIVYHVFQNRSKTGTVALKTIVLLNLADAIAASCRLHSVQGHDRLPHIIDSQVECADASGYKRT